MYMKVISDMKKYLDHIDEKSEGLNTLQKEKLETILSSMLTLLVALKNYSRLGKISDDIFDI